MSGWSWIGCTIGSCTNTLHSRLLREKEPQEGRIGSYVVLELIKVQFKGRSKMFSRNDP